MSKLVLDEAHLQLASLLYQQTLLAQEQPSKALMLEALPCNGTLASLLGLKADAVKKRLQLLRLLGLVQVVEHSPKRYRFDVFALRPGWKAPPLSKGLHQTEAAAFGEGIDGDVLNEFIQAVQGQNSEEEAATSDWLAPTPKLAKKRNVIKSIVLSAC
jgi:hypothetical protein